jgi:hypothetical protein
MKVIIELLQGRENLIKEIYSGISVYKKNVSLLIVSIALLSLEGIMLGSTHSFLQALSSAVKLPILFICTLIICIPTLFIFNSLFGSKRNIGEVLGVSLVSLCTTALILFGFFPVALLFRLTTKNYFFFLTLNVFFMAISAFIGIKSFYQAYDKFPEQDTSNSEMRLKFLRIWFLLYAFVGTQLAWSLRPFFGTPDTAFVLLRDLEGNFYVAVFKSFLHIFK